MAKKNHRKSKPKKKKPNKNKAGKDNIGKSKKNIKNDLLYESKETSVYDLSVMRDFVSKLLTIVEKISSIKIRRLDMVDKLFTIRQKEFYSAKKSILQEMSKINILEFTEMAVEGDRTMILSMYEDLTKATKIFFNPDSENTTKLAEIIKTALFPEIEELYLSFYQTFYRKVSIVGGFEMKHIGMDAGIVLERRQMVVSKIDPYEGIDIFRCSIMLGEEMEIGYKFFINIEENLLMNDIVIVVSDLIEERNERFSVRAIEESSCIVIYSRENTNLEKIKKFIDLLKPKIKQKQQEISKINNLLTNFSLWKKMNKKTSSDDNCSTDSKAVQSFNAGST